MLGAGAPVAAPPAGGGGFGTGRTGAGGFVVGLAFCLALGSSLALAMRASAAAFFLASKIALFCLRMSSLGGGHFMALPTATMAVQGSAVPGAVASAEEDAPALASGAPEAAPSVEDGTALLLVGGGTLALVAVPTLPFGVGINGGGDLNGLTGFGGVLYMCPPGLRWPSKTCGSSPGSDSAA